MLSGKRRISDQQLSPLKKLGKTEPEFLEQEKWKAFWDAPLVVPGSTGTNPGLPHLENEIRRTDATYQSSNCAVKTDGSSIEVTFPRLSMGIFSGALQFTVYKGTNLLRQEGGFKRDTPKRVIWRDVAHSWQKYEFFHLG